ncbi:MAG: hypothetical protein RR850_18230, partial [Hafnia sp.]
AAISSSPIEGTENGRNSFIRYLIFILCRGLNLKHLIKATTNTKACLALVYVENKYKSLD